MVLLQLVITVETICWSLELSYNYLDFQKKKKSYNNSVVTYAITRQLEAGLQE